MVAPALSSSFRPSDAAQPENCTERFGKSSNIVRMPAADRPLTGDQMATLTASLIAATFPGRSENEVCDRAAQALQVNASTIRNLLRKRTREPSARIVLTCMSIMAASGRDPLAIIGPHLPALQRALANATPMSVGGSVTGNPPPEVPTAARSSLAGRPFSE